MNEWHTPIKRMTVWCHDFLSQFSIFVANVSHCLQILFTLSVSQSTVTEDMQLNNRCNNVTTTGSHSTHV